MTYEVKVRGYFNPLPGVAYHNRMWCLQTLA